MVEVPDQPWVIKHSIVASKSRSRMARLDLYGFDFLASQSLSGRRSAADVPHDFNAEAEWVAGLQRSDPRIRLAGAPT